MRRFDSERPSRARVGIRTPATGIAVASCLTLGSAAAWGQAPPPAPQEAPPTPPTEAAPPPAAAPPADQVDAPLGPPGPRRSPEPPPSVVPPPATDFAGPGVAVPAPTQPPFTLAAVVPGATLDFHGFVSPGAYVSFGNNFLGPSKHGSFEFTEVGFNVTATFSDKLRSGIQFFTRDFGETGNYTPKVDWFYIDYRADDLLGIRLGRVKIPFGLYNDSSDVDAARVPILLPQSTYPVANRDFLLAQTGAALYGRIDLQAAGDIAYDVYAGTIFLPIEGQTTVQTQVTSIEVPYLVGFRALWQTPIEGLRLGPSVQALRLDASFLLEGEPVDVELPAVLAMGSVEYIAGNLQLAAEYGRWVVDVRSSNSEAVPPGRFVSERGYVMASYGVTSWLHPGAQYSVLFPNVDDRSGREGRQHDVGLTFRFDVNDHWLVKLEGHWMNGTAGLNPRVNDGVPRDKLQQNWGLLLAKTTAHF